MRKPTAKQLRWRKRFAKLYGRRRAAKKASRKPRHRKGKKRMAMPAALARWHRQHRGHKKHHRRRRRHHSKALVRYTKPTIIRVGGGGMRKHHRRRRRHHHRGLGFGGGGIARKFPLMAAAALWGYATDVKKLDILDKIPKVGGVPKEAIVGAALELTGLTRRGIGPIRAHWLDALATAGLIVGANQIGKSNFKLSGWDED